MTISSTNWNKPGLFGKLVLWNSPLYMLKKLLDLLIDPEQLAVTKFVVI